MDVNQSCDHCHDPFEVLCSFEESRNITACSCCGAAVEKLCSLCSGYSKKQPNQYPEVLKAKYWRDQNGVRHRVTAADGHAKSATVSRRKTVSDETVEARRKSDLSRRRS